VIRQTSLQIPTSFVCWRHRWVFIQKKHVVLVKVRYGAVELHVQLKMSGYVFLKKKIEPLNQSPWIGNISMSPRTGDAGVYPVHVAATRLSD